MITVHMDDRESYALGTAIRERMEKLSKQSPSADRDEQMNALSSISMSIVPQIKTEIRSIKASMN